MKDLTFASALDTPKEGRGGAQGLRDRLVSHWLRRIRHGQLTVTFPSGRVEVFGGAAPGPCAAIMLRNRRLIGRVLLGGDLGFAESYLAGEWDTPQLSALLLLMARNLDGLAPILDASWPRAILNRIGHAGRANTRAGSRRNIAAHYDLGNDFYRLWLDRTMTYSSGLFEDMAEPHEDAQRRKYLALARDLDLRPGDRVLEIGCGWGGFAEFAAGEFGCSVTAVTLSAEQAAFARDRVARARLAGRVEIQLEDYRDVAGRFDKIASIEMFEAVGEENWPVFFAALNRLLVPGGRAGLQVITIAEDRFAHYRRNPDFIQNYVFPGGMLPSPSALERAAGAAGLRLRTTRRFAPSYAETLRRWDAAFAARRAEVEGLGFDDRFCRLWRYYLAYCEVGFDLGLIDVGHHLVARP